MTGSRPDPTTAGVDASEPGITSTPSPTAARASARPAAPRVRRAAQAAFSLTLAIALLGWGLPYLTDTSWGTILGIITGIGWSTFAYLLGLMFLGLYCYTFTLKGSLPGLSHGHALLANLAGSGVSNVMPAGGAVGAALTYAMFRSWRFGHRRISTSIIVTTVWNLLARLTLPVVAAVVLLPERDKVPQPMVQGALAGGAVGGLIAALLIGVIVSPRAAGVTGRVVGRFFGPIVGRLRGGAARGSADFEELALDLRAKIIDLVSTRWPSLTFGLLGFMGVYFLLFRACAEAVGVHLSWPHVFAAYAVGRLLTAVAVTPGGIGVSEAGAAAVLLALGVPGEATAACVTLFALFSFVLEIPFGALAALLWVHTRHRYRRRPHPESGATPGGSLS